MSNSEGRRSAFNLLLMVLFVVGFWNPAAAANPVGVIVHLFGRVELRTSEGGSWQPAHLHQKLLPGDLIQTGPASGVAILCADESQIKLKENTSLELREVAVSDRLRFSEIIPAAFSQAVASLYRVNHGEVWLRNKNDKFRFELETPAVTAAIRGTEFNLKVTQEGVSLLTVLEGSISFANPWGELVLTAGEEGLARPGQAPNKRIVLNPEDAVQWALYYPGIFNPRELPLDLAGLPGAEPQVQEALRLYNAGHFPAARAALSPVLARQPDNPAALTLQGWLWLQDRNPAAARQAFQRVQPASDFSLVGLALAIYRLEDQTAAFQLLRRAQRERPPSPMLLTMTGSFALLTGQPREAHRLLEAARERAPAAILPQALLIQLHLVQNHKALARVQAEALVGQAPNSPLVWLSLALVQIAYFDLPAATKNLQRR